MTGNEIREKFLNFFRERGHAIIPSASVIPENDPTVLFTTAGMHPLVPFLLGESHPMGRRLADAQKCIRTGDIDEVGDNRHLTFFEMLGNWSLGDYFKKDAIEWSYEFLTRVCKLPPTRLSVTVFAGDEDASRDDESVEIWQSQFRRDLLETSLGNRIYAYPKAKNWWGPAGQTGPCGPDTEMFYDTLGLSDAASHALGWTGAEPCHPNCDCGRHVEVWNDVFMQYFKNADGKFEPLKQQNVDTGMGLERMAMVLQGRPTVFETEMFRPIIAEIERLSGKAYAESVETTRAMRIVADHLKTATFILGDERGVTPSNVDQGYILRRLIRRAVRYGRQLGIGGNFTAAVAEKVIVLYGATYPELARFRGRITTELTAEEDKFGRTLQHGLVEAKKLIKKYETVEKISGGDAFFLYESYGFPMELTEEVTGKKVDAAEWAAEQKKHQELSRAGAEQKFAGGLADHSEIVVRMHTATHLLHAALRKVLGTHVEQRGSNITPERLRFDFSHGQKMTAEEIAEVEKLVNGAVEADYPVTMEMTDVAGAKAKGAIGLFEEKYAALGNQIKLYSVGNDERGYFSREICNGPHVTHTAQVGRFKIAKEEASSAGVRRIKAALG